MRLGIPKPRPKRKQNPSGFCPKAECHALRGVAGPRGQRAETARTRRHRPVTIGHFANSALKALYGL